jgi:biopolymer transport protein TolQ
LQPVINITGESLPPSASSFDVFRLIADSGPVGLTVLAILVVFSLVSWAIILSKWASFRRAEAQSRSFLEVFRRSKKFSEVRAVSLQLSASPLVALFQAGYNELDYQLRSRGGSHASGFSESEADASRTKTIKSLESVARALVRAANGEVGRLEKRLSFLATTGSTTPFIGLFGTVWGIMTAFQRIGVVQAANISVVAPGVSEALIATAAGLAAAIPAVVFYNYFVSQVRRLTTDMDDFALEFLNIVERNFT